jgi:hypothetical protein
MMSTQAYLYKPDDLLKVPAEGEWIHEGLPPLGSEARVWLSNGSVRRVKRDSTHGYLHFTDCTHPLQNVYCDSEKVKAWRLDTYDAKAHAAAYP